MVEIPLIYSDEDFIIINKPPGLPVHGGPSVRGNTLVDFLLENFPETKGVGDEPGIRPGIVHRLDKNTSGIMAVARNQKSFLLLKELFQKRLVEKTYLAIVCGKIKERGVISLPMGRTVRNPLKRGVVGPKSKLRGERPAVTEYRMLKEGKGFSLAELKPKTGRMHQLRVHLASIGHPVACDTLYGGKKVCCPASAKALADEPAGKPARQLLHALSLSFSFPEGRKLYFEADPPEDFAIAQKQIF